MQQTHNGYEKFSHKGKFSPLHVAAVLGYVAN